MSEVITDPKMRKFVHSSINNDFGLTINQVANKCKSYGRFKAWLNSDVARIKQVLNKVKENGVSPAFFASYERTEGYNSSWGWLNHTKVNGDPITDATSVSQWIVSQSKNTTDKPAWIDYANYKDFVPADIKQKGNADFANMKSGSIGKVIIAGTAAATWEVYYPNGLKKEYNGVQNYGAPINNMIITIEAWGGTIDGSHPDPDPGPDPGPDPDPDPEPPKIDFSQINQFFDVFSKDTQKYIIDLLNKSLFDYGTSLFFGNSYLRVNKNLPKTYQINVSKKFKNEFDDLFKKGKKELEKIIGGIEIPVPDPNPDPDPDPDPDPSSDKYFPVNKKASGINFWYPPHDSDLKNNMDWGYRTTGVWHAGYDIGGGGSSHDIYAVRNGKVIDVKYQDLSGYLIIIQHTDDQYFTLYQHLQKDSTVVKIGDTVKGGQKIARMGSSGGNYAVHLHFELAKSQNDFWSTRTLDPKPYLGITADNTTNLKNPV